MKTWGVCKWECWHGARQIIGSAGRPIIKVQFKRSQDEVKQGVIGAVGVAIYE